MPAFLYLNSSLAKPLLVPLLEQQNSSQASFPFAAKDLGAQDRVLWEKHGAIEHFLKGHHIRRCLGPLRMQMKE